MLLNQQLVKINDSSFEAAAAQRSRNYPYRSAVHFLATRSDCRGSGLPGGGHRSYRSDRKLQPGTQQTGTIVNGDLSTDYTLSSPLLEGFASYSQLAITNGRNSGGLLIQELT